MNSTRLSSQHSSSYSQNEEFASDRQNADDGYDYNIVDDAPEAQPTRAKDFPLAKASDSPIESRISGKSGDLDHAFTETMPNIYQRRAGGRRANIPDVDLDLEKGPLNGASQNEANSPKEVPEMASIRLRWTMPDVALELNAGKPDIEVQEAYLQRRSVQWHHVQRNNMQLGAFEEIVNQYQSPGLSGGERGLTRRLLKRVRNEAERDFVGGRFLIPLALRYDNQDISRYTVDKTCIFFGFPYFEIAKPGLRHHFDKGSPQHPPRTLLQSHFRLNKTTDRDEYQCISLLGEGAVASSINAINNSKRNLSGKTIEDLVYVPQLWGIIVGLDTLITNGPIDKLALQGSAMKIESSLPRPVGYRLSLVRILFTYQNRREDLIYPVIQCDSWFGLLNKQQQILEFLESDKEKVRPNEYRFWFDEQRPITISNWSSLLRKSQSYEIVNIWMKKDKPKKHVQSAEGNRNIRQTTFDFPGLDIPDNPSDVPVVSAFFAWDILDEFGEPETVSLSYRVSKFLKAIYNEVVADSHITVEGKSEQEVQEYVTTTQGNPLVSELVQNFRLIFQLYVPKEPNTASEPIEMYWGAVYEIAERFTEDESLHPSLRKYSTMVSSIVFHAQRLHQGVYCLRPVQDPETKEWRWEHAVAKGAILLAVVVDALGAILQMIVETVRFLSYDSFRESADIKEAFSDVTRHGRDACELLKAARDQLIREADGRDKNGNIGPVVTPEAITIALLERLTCGVLRAETIDIIHLYEECLEHLALRVENEASRRLLQRINIFQEEVAIVKDVLAQQDKVLSGLRASLDPTTFRTPSITRKLRYNFECKAIDRILTTIREQMKNCDELLERAKLLAVQNVQLVETFQDDNSKAIFVFTIVTVLFLPMGFVASFFGMNVIGVSATTTPVRHFWEIALPLTFGIVIPCTIIALKGEDVYFGIARMYRGLKKALVQRKPRRADISGA